jgi:hypothetical protein
MGDWVEKEPEEDVMPVELPGKSVFWGDALEIGNEVLPGWQAVKIARNAKTKYR